MGQHYIGYQANNIKQSPCVYGACTPWVEADISHMLRQIRWRYRCEVQTRDTSAMRRYGDIGAPLVSRRPRWFPWGTKVEKGKTEKVEEPGRQRDQRERGEAKDVWGCLGQGDKVVSSYWVLKHIAQKSPRLWSELIVIMKDSIRETVSIWVILSVLLKDIKKALQKITQKGVFIFWFTNCRFCVHW